MSSQATVNTIDQDNAEIKNVAEMMPTREELLMLESQADIDADNDLPAELNNLVDAKAVKKIDYEAGLDLLKKLVKKLKKEPRLTREAEVALAKQIEQAAEEIKAQLTRIRDVQEKINRLKKNANQIPLTIAKREKDEAIDALERSKERYELARQKMISGNMLAAFYVAQKQYFQESHKMRGVELEDIMQHSMIGLIKAVIKFDWRVGCRFLTYAQWWIRQEIDQAVNQTGHTIKIPLHVEIVLNKYWRAVKRLRSTLHRKPDDAEVAVYMDVPIEHIWHWKMLRYVQNDVSLSDPLPNSNDNEKSLLAVGIPDNITPSPEDLIITLDKTNIWVLAKQTLTEPQFRVMALRYGSISHTLEEIGQMLNLTRERIRQIEAKALKKLRHPTHVGAFAAYLR